jgi:hypothetical protein
MLWKVQQVWSSNKHNTEIHICNRPVHTHALWHNTWSFVTTNHLFTLRVGRLCRKDEQVLVNKVADKLPGWKGKLLNKEGRLALVNSVLSSMVIYHMTVFPLSKWAIKKIDRTRCTFLWQGAEEPWRGHCLVNWRRVQWPKKIWGLGILDLEHFNRALRLQWQWQRWSDDQKPWSKMILAHTTTEQELFWVCTTITVTVGDGAKTSFWHDRCLYG